MRNKVYKFSAYKALYYSIILYILSTMTQTLIPFIPLNRIAYFFIILCVSIILLTHIDRASIAFLLLFAVDFLLVLLIYNIDSYFDDYIYFFSALEWLLFLTKTDRRSKLLTEFVTHPITNKAVAFFSVALTAFALVTKTGYYQTWGGEMYFVGYSGLTHTAASSFCLVIALMLIVYCNKKFSWIIMLMLLIMTYAIFETGARTFIIPAVILIYIYISQSSGSLKAIIYALAITIGTIILLRSNIINKFIFTNTGDQYSAYKGVDLQTSGRTVFWAIDLGGFFNADLFAKIFGQGHSYVYELNSKFYHLKIWAHNDFIQLLVAGGLMTLTLYISALFHCIRSVTQNKKIFSIVILAVYCIVPAIMNGFYNYAHFFLSFVLLCLLYDTFTGNGRKLKRKRRSAETGAEN